MDFFIACQCLLFIMFINDLMDRPDIFLIICTQYLGIVNIIDMFSLWWYSSERKANMFLAILLWSLIIIRILISIFK